MMTTENPTPNASETGSTESGTTASTETGTTSTNESTVLGGTAETAEGKTAETGETSTETGKTEGTTETTAAAVPDKYELTVPDGFDGIDSDVLAEATPVLKDLKLTNEQADKLTPIAAQLVKKTMDRAEAAITERAIQNRKDWAEAFDKDPEIGGANKQKTIDFAAKAFDHYGIKAGEGVRQLLEESGLGNHPDLIRFVAAVGRDLAEGTHDRGTAVNAPKTPEGTLYGAEFQPKG
jgi:hypothetical protein